LQIIVCIKQVPDIRAVQKIELDPNTSTIVREGIPSIVNPLDECAVEEAVRLIEKHGGKVVALTMGPPQAKDALIKCLAMDTDEAIHLCDKAFAGSDTLATSYAISAAIRKVGKFDLILCGKHSIDGETAQLGPSIAEYLSIPQITCVNRIEIKDRKILARQEVEAGFQLVESELPALLTISSGINEPRIPTFISIADAFEKDIPTWSAQDLEVNIQQLGLEGSPTKVDRVWAPEHKPRGQIMDGNPAEVASKLVNLLKQDKVL